MMWHVRWHISSPHYIVELVSQGAMYIVCTLGRIGPLGNGSNGH
jgi:hypothetical protein